ncbi:alpha/beta fold hydrolase [Glutamicibacter sp. JC586]|uniref:alpha/beta fold hydrolase n=1 Tax=Glutamicibacter sp. JC586 TaxID=2590552 RepID=UPI00135CB35B|nr:alpha/beta fold hydrolase [Glutamicibacter sp. JC586]
MSVQAETSTPSSSGFLEVNDGHRLYWEEFGTPNGVPALHLHGGPGGTLGSSGYRQRWDLNRTRLIGFEQRGCGRSSPSAADPCVPKSQFSTQKFIEDIEALRVSLGIDRWIINGVSWGTTLALAYAQAHPQRVVGLVLFAVTTTSRREVQWITESMGAIYPEAWHRLSSFAQQHAPAYDAGRIRLVEAYADMLWSPDLQLRDKASHEWALWEDTHISLGSGEVKRDPRWEDTTFRHTMTRLTTLFWARDGFCDPPILENLDRLQNLPAIFIHGRSDVSSPTSTAWKLHVDWPGSELHVVDADGHGGAEMVELWTNANLKMINHAS